MNRMVPSSPPSPPRWRRRTISKWAAMAASIWIQCSSGSSYCFGLYSPLLKSSQSYDQSTLDSVAFFKDLGANIGVLSGLLYSSAGPAAVLAAGSIQCFAGYFLMWLSVTRILPRPPPVLMCLYMLLAAQAQTYYNTADVVTAVQNFPDSRGTAIGIMKGFLGLSGAILIQIYLTLFNGKASSFLLMLALLPSILPLLLMYFVRVQHNRNTVDDKQHLNAFSLIAVITAAYLMFLIIVHNVLKLGLSAARIFAFGVLLLLLLSPVTVVIKAHLREPAYHRETEKAPLIIEDKLSKEEGKACIEHQSSSSTQDRGANLNLFEAMRTCDFWILFAAMSCGMGSGLATINNMSQIGSSLGYSTRVTGTLVSLWSIWNFLGRFGSGYFSDYMLYSRGLPRPLFISISLGVMSIGHLIISQGFPGSLHIGSVLVGVCYGCQWALMPGITSELFGLRHFGTIFNTIAIASPIGSYIFSVRIVGYIYDVESSGKGTCSGKSCFMLSFLIIAAVTLLGSVVSLALFFRTRRFYKQIILDRLQTCAR